MKTSKASATAMWMACGHRGPLSPGPTHAEVTRQRFGTQRTPVEAKASAKHAKELEASIVRVRRPSKVSKIILGTPDVTGGAGRRYLKRSES